MVTVSEHGADLHVQDDEISGFPYEIVLVHAIRREKSRGLGWGVHEKSSAASNGSRVHLKMATAVDLFPVSTGSLG